MDNVKIFASPYTKKYGNSAFQIDKETEEIAWKQLPEVDILVTHGPPFGILDKTNGGKNAGSKLLLKEVLRLKPKLHLFGHIH